MSVSERSEKVDPRPRVRGYHRCLDDGVGSYDLRADRNGVVYCGGCGARDLLPVAEAAAAAMDGPRFNTFARKFRREVQSGNRAPIYTPPPSWFSKAITRVRNKLRGHENAQH